MPDGTADEPLRVTWSAPSGRHIASALTWASSTVWLHLAIEAAHGPSGRYGNYSVILGGGVKRDDRWSLADPHDEHPVRGGARVDLPVRQAGWDDVERPVCGGVQTVGPAGSELDSGLPFEKVNVRLVLAVMVPW
jgi:hypothetical protein